MITAHTPPDQWPALITTRELAAILRLAPRTLRQLRWRRKLPIAPVDLGIGRELVWRASDVRAWLAGASPKECG